MSLRTTASKPVSFYLLVQNTFSLHHKYGSAALDTNHRSLSKTAEPLLERKDKNMPLHDCSSDPPSRELFSDATWNMVYSSLRPHVRRWIYTSGITSWRDQEEDIVEDIVQVSVIRTYEYTLRPQDANSSPLRSPQAMAYTIAHNYYNDLRRREGRIDRIGTDESCFRDIDETDLFDLILEQMYLEWLFANIAVTISKLPQKQRQALLIDLANRSSFCEQGTQLEQALLAVGIRLQDYQQPLSQDRVMRSRHAASLTIAYHRLRASYVTAA